MASNWGRVARIMVCPQRHPKTGVFRLRMAVPEALRLRVGEVLGRPPGTRHRELIRSLETKDAKEAKARMPDALRWAEEVLAAAREGGRSLTEREVFGLVGVWCSLKLEQFDRDPDAALWWRDWEETMPDWEEPSVPPGTDPSEEPEWTPRDERLHREWVATLMGDETRALLTLQGVVADADSLHRLGAAMASKLPYLLAEHERRKRGDFTPDPRRAALPEWEPLASLAATAPVAPHGPTLTDLLGRYRIGATVNSETMDSTKYEVERLAEFLGHEDAGRISRADLIRYRDDTKRQGLSNQTWNNRLSRIAQVFENAENEGLIVANPTRGLRLETDKTKPRHPYSDDEAARILNAARNETSPSLRWAHWVMAFTGMRVREVLQLVGGDIRQDEGVWFISVNADTDEKSVKTGVRRHVPLHPALIAEGFLAHVQAFAADVSIFPDKKPDKHGKTGGRGWNLTGKWVRKVVGITDPVKAPNHSWRHRIEDELRNAEVLEEFRDAIVGHSRKTTGKNYGIRGAKLARLWADLAKVPVPLGVEPPPGFEDWPRNEAGKPVEGS